MVVQAEHHTRTSTCCKTAMTTTSSPEFLQPTMTPGTSVCSMSVGQNTRINTSCSTISIPERASASELVASGYS
jgi:hypothetical protein